MKENILKCNLCNDSDCKDYNNGTLIKTRVILNNLEPIVIDTDFPLIICPKRELIIKKNNE